MKAVQGFCSASKVVVNIKVRTVSSAFKAFRRTESCPGSRNKYKASVLFSIFLLQSFHLNCDIFSKTLKLIF
jgi:hypothetical protein